MKYSGCQFFSLCVLLARCVAAHEFSYEESIFRNISSLILHEQRIRAFISKNASSECAVELDHYLRHLSKLSAWALKMFDSGTKIPSGIATGNVVDYGTFDECLDISTTIANYDGTIDGKYCLGFIPISSILGKVKTFNKFELDETRVVSKVTGGRSMMFATCLPAACSVQDFEEIYSVAKFGDQFCQSKDTRSKKLSGGAIATIVLLCVILFIAILSTCYDVYLYYAERKPAHIIFVAFSILNNGKKLLSTSNSLDQIGCLHGIRVISIMWVILAHRFVNVSNYPIANPKFLVDWQNDMKNMYIMNGTLSVDTFFVLSGFLVSYVFMSSMSKGVKFNILLFYVHRYLRLTPVFAVVVLIYSTLLTYLGSGPWWFYSIGNYEKACQQNWWNALLYFQNYHYESRICVGQTWYLCVDTQLYVLSPIMLIPLHRWPKIGLSLTVFFGLASMLAAALVGWFYELRGFFLANSNLTGFMKNYYLVSHTRATPWLMGILLGYYVFQIKRGKLRLSLNTTISALVWILSLGIMTSCILTGHNILTDPYDRLGNSFYIALMRPSWSLGVIGIILMCALGYGGPVNWFLSLPAFQILSKLTYCMYLVHMALQLLQLAQTRVAPHLSNLDVIYQFWGDYIMTLATALIFTLLFESPIITIEKVIFGDSKKNKQKKLPLSNS